VSTDPGNLDDPLLSGELADQVADLTPEDFTRLSTSRPRAPDMEGRGRIRGQIVSIYGSDVFVDIGGKSEGVVPLEEFAPDDPPEVGQTLSLVPQGFDRESRKGLTGGKGKKNKKSQESENGKNPVPAESRIASCVSPCRHRFFWSRPSG
jgi:ribosomal protein S1